MAGETISPEYILVLKREDLIGITPGISEIPIPEGFTLVRDEAYLAEQRRLEEIKQLEESIAAMPEPREQELIEMGRIAHPYYQTKMRLDLLNNQM